MSHREHPLRQEAESLVSGALKLDRGSALYYVPGVERVSETRMFTIESQGDGARMTPTPLGIHAFYNWAGPQARLDELARDLVKFQGAEITPPEIHLFILGIKQLELNATPMLWMQYDKSLRQLAANALRTGNGGGALPACWCAMMLALKGPI